MIFSSFLWIDIAFGATIFKYKMRNKMKITELAYVHGLLDSALNILEQVKKNLDDCDLNEEQKIEFQNYMDESLSEFISEEECDCEECTCEREESEKDKIIKHLSRTIVMLTERQNAE